MGFFSNLGAVNWQAKIAAKVSVYLEESFDGRPSFDADNVAETLFKIAWSYEARYFNPKDPMAPSVLPLVAFVLACGACTDSLFQCPPKDREVIKKALRTVITEFERTTPRSMLDSELILTSKKVLEAS